MKTRLQQFLNAENINQSQLAEMLGVGRPSISHILSGRNNPGYDFFLAMTKAFPNLSMDWLLAGKGKMYKAAPAAAAQPSNPATTDAPGDGQQSGADLAVPVQDEKSPRECDISSREGEKEANMRSSEGGTSPENTPNSTDKQRVITKIMVFFSDGTFSELVP